MTIQNLLLFYCIVRVRLHVTKLTKIKHVTTKMFHLCLIITYNMFVLMEHFFTTNAEFNGESSEVRYSF